MPVLIPAHVPSEYSAVLRRHRDHAANTRLTSIAPSADNPGAMPELFPLQFLLATFAGWVNRHQAQVVEYIVEENRALKEQLGGRRLRLTDDQRRRLAAKGKILGR